MDFKTEIISILRPIFGDSIIKIVDENYDSKVPGDLLELTFHMLSGYMGEKNAKNALANLIKKFPNIRLEVKNG